MGDESPWREYGVYLRSNGLSQEEEQAACEKSKEVARATLGEELYARLCKDGYVTVRPLAAEGSPVREYRLRPGRLPECFFADGGRMYMCVLPWYTMPDLDFLAVMYLRLRDDEAATLMVANWAARDTRPLNTFGPEPTLGEWAERMAAPPNAVDLGLCLALVGTLILGVFTVARILTELAVSWLLTVIR